MNFIKPILLIFLVFLPIQAEPNIQFSKATYLGLGCLEDSVSLTLSPDASALSILLGKFRQKSSKRASSRLTCHLAIPVQITNFTQNQAYIQADYRGFQDLPDGAVNHRLSRYDLDQKFYKEHSTQVLGPTGDNYTFTSTHTLNISCTGNHTLNIFLESYLENSLSYSDASYELDSIDLSGPQKATASILPICNGLETNWISIWMLLSVLATTLI